MVGRENVKRESIFSIQTNPLLALANTPRPRSDSASWAALKELALIEDTTWSARLESLRNYGDFSLAYSAAFQPGLEYFFCDDGFLSYRVRRGVAFVLADPLVNTSTKPKILDRFLEQFPRACFCQIHRDTAEHLVQRGFYINEMGVDTRVSLTANCLGGREREWLRYARNWTERRGFRVEEMNGLDAMRVSELVEVSDEWRSTRTIRKREVRFLNRPIVPVEEEGVRKFFLSGPTGRLEAFAFFDPIYSAGEIEGYVTSFKRRRKDAPGYCEPAMMAAAMQQFAEEGRVRLQLGLSPLYQITDREFRANPFLHLAFRYYFSSWWANRYFYRVQEHARYKERFRGEVEKVYFATNALFNDIRLFSLFQLCGVV